MEVRAMVIQARREYVFKNNARMRSYYAGKIQIMHQPETNKPEKSYF